MIGCRTLASLTDNTRIWLGRISVAESDITNKSSDDSDAAEERDFEGARRGGLRNVMAAIKHINEASVTESVRQRISDYVTIGLVVICIMSLVAAVALPVAPGLKLLPLLLTILAVVLYMINRLGIIVSLSARQALIVWQIVIASFWLGVTSSMMVMMTCFYFFSSKLGQ
jgi:hypothetical protein